MMKGQNKTAGHDTSQNLLVMIYIGSG